MTQVNCSCVQLSKNILSIVRETDEYTMERSIRHDLVVFLRVFLRVKPRTFSDPLGFVSIRRVHSHLPVFLYMKPRTMLFHSIEIGTFSPFLPIV